nr:hypothetical protein Itr_chr15CG01580 [Ipomoea trifida]GMD96097.1 hypothetical protein Iba_chr15bCG1490 [Ipomoea batatas]GMD98290.1 hypothetical protein Iba_chr15dCG1300 [Ipomoea batatas]GME00010.1 hypothetical protein Iba_chr15fCG1280 [Ipomoea batatas]
MSWIDLEFSRCTFHVYVGQFVHVEEIKPYPFWLWHVFPFLMLGLKKQKLYIKWSFDIDNDQFRGSHEV